ncbi:MAG TPA: methionine--tRNA ligase subunit beta, partial [Bacteroidales bacterium]|nr:methionine--tRNA ligase subunit beta [Bacteroidales bacterium]
RFRESQAEMMNLARLGNKYLTDSEPWKIFKQDPERVKTILNISLQICANLAILCEPYLPFTAAKLTTMLNMETLKWNDAGNPELLPPGHQMKQAEYLFDRIDDDVINAQVQKLLDTKKSNELSARKVDPAKETIDYDTFSRIDIRVGKILEAEKVPKTTKLLKLKVDTGVDIRTVVSGIAEYYKPEDIVGKRACFLVNLAPRMLRGIESNGMILMAENADGNLTFIAPEDDFEPGSKVS